MLALIPTIIFIHTYIHTCLCSYIHMCVCVQKFSDPVGTHYCNTLKRRVNVVTKVTWQYTVKVYKIAFGVNYKECLVKSQTVEQ